MRITCLGAKRSMLEKFINQGEHLDPIHVHDEVWNWPVQKGSKARETAGVIHSAMERRFISAEFCFFANIKELSAGRPK